QRAGGAVAAGAHAPGLGQVGTLDARTGLGGQVRPGLHLLLLGPRVAQVDAERRDRHQDDGEEGEEDRDGATLVAGVTAAHEQVPAVDVVYSTRATLVRVTSPLLGIGMNGKCMFTTGNVAVNVTLPPISPGAGVVADPSAFM